MIYSSIDNNKIKDIKKLQTKKYRDLQNEFIIEGDHLVKEAYEKGILKLLILEDGTSIDIDIDTDTIICNHKVMRFLSNLDTPNKVMGVCKKKEGKLSGNKILMLDNVQDPGNLGTIIRSAVAFNIDTIVLSEDTVDLYNPKVIRGSQGMLFKANIVIMDIKDAISKLDGYTLYGTSVTGGNSLKSIDIEDKYVVIMGNEGNGVHKDILDLCDKYLYIDMNKTCESLNVAVATSIILYELDK